VDELEAEVRSLQEKLLSARAVIEKLVSGETRPAFQLNRPAVAGAISLAASQTDKRALHQADTTLGARKPAFRASDGQLARLLDLAPVAILEADAAGVFLYANAAAVSILELTYLELQGMPFDAVDWSLGWPDGRPVMKCDRPITRALQGETVEDIEIVLRRPDPARRDLVLRVGAVPIWTDTGRIEGALVTLADVTARHAAIEALQASEDRSRLAFEIASACAWEYDPASGVSTWDAAARRLLNLPDVLPFEAAIAHFVHPDDVEQAKASVASALDPAGEGRYALQHRAAPAVTTSGERWLQSLGQAYFDGVGAARRAVRMVCVTTDVTERRLAEERRTRLVAELNHRVKNTLAVVQALAEQTRRATDKRPAGSPERRHFHADFQSRLLALARAHDLLTRENWEGATLQDVISAATQPFIGGVQQPGIEPSGSERIEWAGPVVQVAPEASVALSIGIFELATNAVKHGALSAPGGQVTVTWAVSGDRNSVALQWEERGGPDVSGPPPLHLHGFGLRLLERGLARQVGGNIRLDFAPAGLCCHMILPLNGGRLAPS
jgi:two-component sensor histidine kinase/PAS domain-containing protein